MKFFGLPKTKWRSCKIFVKLNGNHLLVANIFKLHKCQTFGLLKTHNMSKIWFASNKIQFVKKFGLLLTSFRRNYFLILAFFMFPNFKWLLSKILWNYHPFLKWISRVLMKFYYVTNIVDLHTLDNETTALLKRFEISTEMHVVSLVFLNKEISQPQFWWYICALC